MTARTDAHVDTGTPARRRPLGAALTAVTDDVARRRLLDAILGPLDEPGSGVDPMARYGEMLEVLGVAVPTTSDQTRRVVAQHIRRVLHPALWNLNLPALVLVLDVLRHRYAEARLTRTDPQAEARSDAVHDWLTVLWEEHEHQPPEPGSAGASDGPAGAREAVQEPGDEPGPNAMTVTYDADHTGRRVVF